MMEQDTQALCVRTLGDCARLDSRIDAVARVLCGTARSRRRLFTPSEKMGILYDLRDCFLGRKLIAPDKSATKVETSGIPDGLPPDGLGVWFVGPRSRPKTPKSD